MLLCARGGRSSVVSNLTVHKDLPRSASDERFQDFPGIFLTVPQGKISLKSRPVEIDFWFYMHPGSKKRVHFADLLLPLLSLHHVSSEHPELR